MSADWPFDDPEDVAVFTIKRITDGQSSVLLVTHDEEDSGWQFLDGADVDREDATLVSLGEITGLDPSLLQLADLPVGWIAWRESPETPWKRSPANSEREVEQKILADIDAFGWHVILIPEDDEGPPFGYTIGLHKTFGHPEIVIVGLTDPEVMFSFLNALGMEVKQARRFANGDSTPGIIEGFEVRFSEVPRSAYARHFGYASWYYKGQDYPVLQCLWPDAQGRFPAEAGFDPALRSLQPALGSD
jgi:hypothetical protein